MKSGNMGIAIVGAVIGLVVGSLWIGDLGVFGGVICGVAGAGVANVVYVGIRKITGEKK